MAEQKLASAARDRTRRVRFADERQTLERELRRVCEADAPRTNPASLRRLRRVQVAHSALDRAPVKNTKRGEREAEEGRGERVGWVR